MSELARDERETLHPGASELTQHLGRQSAGKNTVEQRIARDQERRLKRSEAADSEQVPVAGWDPAELKCAVAHESADMCFGSRDRIAARAVDDAYAQPSLRVVVDATREVAQEFGIGSIPARGCGEGQYAGSSGAAGLVGESGLARGPAAGRCRQHSRHERRDDGGVAYGRHETDCPRTDFGPQRRCEPSVRGFRP